MLHQAEDENGVSVNANSSANAGNSNTDENSLFKGNSMLQRPAEFEKDKKQHHLQEENMLSASIVDDLQTNSDDAAGTDRAGTAERKPYGDTELNKGLEAQARDEEGA
ncbi:hypothetical protein [Segetibacter sp.]|jgi:hypothetical protein|uniref:hypothetical protein n=1 Tax=Segetibacter sp. TaxID=2231182 RepID=UPI00261C295C|nr:hypothetical protein [Segetibacter sp.]MCW3082164.1 hypothetical protein [Segetibacter sp.]